MSEFIGRSLGPYEIIEQLGMGGMATVYKARQASMDRFVAIKVLPRHFASDPTFVGRFEQEAKVIARLEHARILPVYDYGSTDGVTYIVMRYLDAGTLAQRIAGGVIPLGETSRIIGQASEGLDYAHRKGVIHRDVKPSNIMLDSNGDVYITDFGISKLIEGTAQFTGSGIVGTPDYVSPEQALGQPLDTRSDIYSLGIVLYQMVTNDVPFHAETPMAVIIKHIHEPLPLPKTLSPDLPDSVQNVILRALAKDPSERYQTCGEMARELASAVAGGVIAPPDLSPARIPTAQPSSTRPMVGSGDAGTIPMAPLNVPTPETAAPRKKGAGLGTVLAILGALLVVAAIAAFVLLSLRTARERRSATETATAATAAAAAAGSTTTAPTDLPASTQAATGQPTAEAAKPLFEDRFDTAQLKQAWRWVNQPPDGQWALADGRLTMSVLPNNTIGDPKAASPQISAPALVLAVPNGAGLVNGFVVQTDVTIAPGADYQSAGLVVLDDNQRPWFNLVRAQCSRAAPACSGDAIYFDDWRSFVLARNSYTARQAGGGQLPANGPVTLRLVFQTRSVNGGYSLDGGRSWVHVGEWPIVRTNKIGFVGLVASSGGGSAAEIPAYFDNFIVTAGGG